MIEIVVQGLPDELISASKFGLFLADKPGFEGATDPVEDGRQPSITIRLTVADDLGPMWEVYKDDRAKRIGAGASGSKTQVQFILPTPLQIGAYEWTEK